MSKDTFEMTLLVNTAQLGRIAALATQIDVSYDIKYLRADGGQAKQLSLFAEPTVKPAGRSPTGRKTKKFPTTLDIDRVEAHLKAFPVDGPSAVKQALHLEHSLATVRRMVRGIHPLQVKMGIKPR